MSFRGASKTTEPGIHNHDREYGLRQAAYPKICNRTSGN